MAEEFHYDCDVFEEDEIIQNHRWKEALPSDIFLIEIRVRNVLQRHNLRTEERTEDPFLYEPMGPLRVKSFWVSKTSLLIDYGAGADVVYDELLSMGVPEYYIWNVIRQVSAFAKTKVEDASNFGREVLSMVIAVAALKMESMFEGSIVRPGGSQVDMPNSKRQRIF